MIGRKVVSDAYSYQVRSLPAEDVRKKMYHKELAIICSFSP